ncbi:hypothetical protein A2U01_0079307, partial [Trifolium medium]|nr:hypothetical protein [Trifolium medium]
MAATPLRTAKTSEPPLGHKDCMENQCRNSATTKVLNCSRGC